MNNLTAETGLRDFQRQALVEKLALCFAELNGYQVEPNLDLNDAQQSQIKTPHATTGGTPRQIAQREEPPHATGSATQWLTWVAMAEVAVTFVEKEIIFGLKGESNLSHDADIAAFSDLDEDTVNELMDT